MLQCAVNIKGLSEEKLNQLFDTLERCGEDVTRQNGIAFPHATEPMAELGYDPVNASWVMAPKGYFSHKTMISPDEFMKEAADIEIELIKKDLAYQITFEEIDWDYFIDTAVRAKKLHGQSHSAPAEERR